MPRIPSVFHLLLRVRHWFGRAAACVVALGPGSFLWPLALSIGVGVGGFALVERRFTATLLQSRATMHWVKPALACIVAAFVLLVAAFGVVVWWTRRHGRRAPLSALWLATCRRSAAFVALPFVVALRESVEKTDAMIALIFAGGSGALCAYTAYQWIGAEAPAERRVVKWVARGAAAAAVTAYVVLFILWALREHWTFQTGPADLGYAANIFRQSRAGEFFRCSLCAGGTRLSEHFDVVFVLLSPLYWIYSFAETLLVFQASWLALGAVPAYLLAGHHSKSEIVGAVFALSYLLYPALQDADLSGFQTITLAIPAFLWLLYFLERGWFRAYAATVAALLLIREDTALSLVGVGCYALFARRDRVRTGWATILVCASYFAVVKLFVLHDAKTLLSTLLSTARPVSFGVSNRSKTEFVLLLFVPLLFLPVVARGRVLIFYAALLALIASSKQVETLKFEVSSVSVPFLFALAAAALSRVREIPGLDGSRWSRALPVGIAVASLLCSWKFGYAAPRAATAAQAGAKISIAKGRARAAWLKDLCRSLPRNAGVSASAKLLPHMGCAARLYLPEQRNHADYVVLSRLGKEDRTFARTIEQEISRGYLVPMKSYDDIRVLRARYPKHLQKARRMAGPSSGVPAKRLPARRVRRPPRPLHAPQP